MGDAAAQQQQKRAFFASFPPTGDKSMNVVSDVHHGSVRTVPLGKIENVVRTDTVPLAVLMNRVGCQVAFQVDFSICFGKAVELCFEGGGGHIPDAMPLLQHDALSNWQQLGAFVYNKLVEAGTNASDASEPDDVATGGGQQRQLVVETKRLGHNEFVFVSFWGGVIVVDVLHAYVEEEQGEGGQAWRENDARFRVREKGENARGLHGR